MSRLLPAALGALSIVLAACSAKPAPHQHAVSGDTSPVLLDGFGRHHQTITTTSREAQAYFDQGLRLVYAFNHVEAERAFREAVRLDPNCAMCYWGIAIAYGAQHQCADGAPGGRGGLRRHSESHRARDERQGERAR
jgi:Tfp pilus assembly protein PilF